VITISSATISSLWDLESFRSVWLPLFRPDGTWNRSGQFGYHYFVPMGLGIVQVRLVTNISSLTGLGFVIGGQNLEELTKSRRDEILVTMYRR
jgi:hypothetical protein